MQLLLSSVLTTWFEELLAIWDLAIMVHSQCKEFTYLLFYGIFKNDVSSSEHTESKRQVNQWKIILNDEEGNSHGLIRGMMLALSVRTEQHHECTWSYKNSVSFLVINSNTLILSLQFHA